MDASLLSGIEKRMVATRVGAINNPSSSTQSDRRGLGNPFTVSDDKTDERAELELNGESFVEQTITTPSDGTIDVLHASSKQPKKHDGGKSWEYYGMIQYDNLNNTLAYESTVGPEIITQMKGLIAHFVAGSTTGGTLTDNFVNDVPENELVVGKWEIEGVEKDSIPGVLSWDVDDAQRGDDTSNFDTCRKVAKDLGVLVGGVIVTVLPDSGAKYLSKIYNDDWMNKKGFTGANVPCANQKSTRMCPKIQMEAELEFLEETAARMVEYHCQSVKIGNEPVMLMKSPETIRAMFSEGGVGINFEHQEPPWNEQ
ncbi:unnamed protein product [Bathycoccus prasinos]